MNGTTPAHPWTDLGSGWARNENGDLVRTVTEIEDVVAEHDHGLDREGRRTAFTRLTRRKLLAGGGKFIANLDGHLADLKIVRASGGVYRLRVVGDLQALADQAVAPLGRSSVAAGKRQSVMA